METKTAMTVAMLCGAAVFGGVFVTLGKDGHALMGLAGGAVIGVMSGMMILGMLSGLIKDATESPAHKPQKLFRIGNSSLFVKRDLSPVEFGHEIARLGYKFGDAQFEDYQSKASASINDSPLLDSMNGDFRPIRYLFSYLIAGSMFCYAKDVLKADDTTMTEVGVGICAGLTAMLTNSDRELIERHMKIVADFAFAVSKEITAVETKSSVSLFLQYVNQFCKRGMSDGLPTFPIELASHINGLGSRFAAVCQNDFQIRYS